MTGTAFFHEHASSPYLSEDRSSQKMRAASKVFNPNTPKQVLFDFIKQQQYTQVKRFFALLLKCHSSTPSAFLQQAKVCTAEIAYLCYIYAAQCMPSLWRNIQLLPPYALCLTFSYDHPYKSAERLHAGGCDKQHCILNGDNKRGAACCAPLMIFTIRYPLILLRNLPPYTLRYSPHP